MYMGPIRKRVIKIKFTNNRKYQMKNQLKRFLNELIIYIFFIICIKTLLEL
jgi:hypothetical protein